MKVLVINCGSSSLKYQLIDSESENALAVGICERIGQDISYLKHTPNGGEKIVIEAAMKNHEDAIKMVLDALTNSKYGVIKSLDEISAVGHRVVHGGEKFATSTIITDEVIQAIEDCNDLAPLHNPANLIGIRACAKLMKGVPMVAVFDTAFHQTMPPKAYLYGLPNEYYNNYKIRKYGFHGTSHSYVSQMAAKFIGRDINDSKIIVCHLGNGASISAVLNGKSIDTSMGFTPLAGLVMGTRSGDIDPSIIDFIAKKENKSLDEIMNVLNKESGMQGMSELSSDFRDLNDAIDIGNEKARIAFDVFVYRVAKYIGSYIVAMNGVDAIVFTAGVGENDWRVREEVCEYLGFLGIKIDLEKNMLRGQAVMLTQPECKVKVCIVPTNEELAIARETVSLL
ncbi:MAG: acetate kinase [Herbinix sp.]|nr:acetate kinase [Herbinix sp.]